MERPITIIDALASLAPGEGWIIENEDYSTIQWNRTDLEKPTEQELQKEVERLVALREEARQLAEQERLKVEQAKQSALAKLAKLGLTEEEARAVIGL